MEFSAAMSHWVAHCPCGRVLRQKRLAPGTDIEHDSAGFEENEAIILENRHLAKGLERAILRRILIALLKKAGPIREACFLQRPAGAQIAHLALSKVRHPFESGDRDHAMRSFATLVA